VDGPGTSAKFNFPNGIAIDSSGNVFVADTLNCLIRKITAGGIVSTFAGGGSGGVFCGYVNGVGTGAWFSTPNSIAIDPVTGNMFVADSDNNLIRKITPGGTVSTFAGGGSASGTASGYAAGTGTSAKFNYPVGIAIDASGNVFVADYINSLIRKITNVGVVSILAGGSGINGYVDATGTNARFFNPQGIAIDASANVFVADSGNNLIRKITSGGLVSTLAGGGGNTASGFVDATGTNAKFGSPVCVAVDTSGNVFVADAGNNIVRKITSGGTVTTLAGVPGISGSSSGLGAIARLRNPHGVVLDTVGSIFVADYGNHLIRKCSLPVLALPACDSTWHHLALTYSPAASPYSLSAFLDGALVFSQAATTITLPARASSSLRLGWSGSLSINAGSLFSGALAELRIYNRLLTTTEVVALSQPPLTGFPNAGASPSSPMAGTTSYAFLCSTAGSFGIATLMRNAADGSWSWAGGVAPNCVACPAGYYSSGAAACTACPVGVTTTSLATGSTSVAACTVCAPGYYGTTASPGTLSASCTAACAAGSFASSAGASTCVACPAGSYSYGGAVLCANCTPGASFSSSAAGCVPPATTAGPADTAFYLSGAQAEGVSAFSTINAPSGASFAASVFSAANASLVLASGSYLSAAGASAPAALPAGGSVAWSVSAWVKCPPPTSWAAVLEWGAAGDAGGGLAPQAAALTVVDAQALYPQSSAVTTFVGSSAGYVDGAGTSAMFNNLFGITIDASGNTFVADKGNYIIRKITPGGSVSTLAGGGGGGLSGFVDGIGTSARFSALFGIAVDLTGNLFVTDNFVVRKVTAGGTVSTFAGNSGVTGYVDAEGTNAQFNNPLYGIACDAIGNLFVTDAGNNLIRKITPGSVVSTIAGGGGTSSGTLSGYKDAVGTSALFSNPYGIAVDASSNLFVTDSGNKLIRKITAGGAVSTFAGVAGVSGDSGYADAVGTNAKFSNIMNSITIDALGNVLVADSGNSVIRKITPGGTVVTVAGRAGFSGSTNGQGAVALFKFPRGITIDSSGYMFVTDMYIVRKCSPPALALPACDSAWHHVAITYSPSATSVTPNVLSTFIDGALFTQVMTSAALVTLPARTSSVLRIAWNGATSVNAGSLFAGSLADLRIYNRTLSAPEVLVLSQPSAASFAGMSTSSTSPPSLGASLALFSCAGGSAGPFATLQRSSSDNSWLWLSSPPACTTCVAGSWSSPGFLACIPCSPGTFSLAGASACSLCPSGTYGDRAGLASAACSGVCANCAAGSTASSSSSLSSAPLSCSAGDARAVPSSLGLQIWPAASPANVRGVDLLVAPLALCQQMTSSAACGTAATVAGVDGVTRYVVGTAAAFNVEPTESLTCAAKS
jgi:sugar lactone lactonase YvrE